jgi:regulator of sigma E protease
VSVLVFAVLLGFMVLVHELGHFVVAKLAGVKVEEFGIGFPPRLAAVRHGETDYSVNAIPLGGFVRMLGEEDPREPRSFARAPKRWRVAILLAGVVMNFIAGAVFFVVAYAAGWPTVTQTEVQVFRTLPDSPAAQAGLRQGDVIVSLAGQPVKTTLDLRRITDEHLGQSIPVEVRRGQQQLTVTLTPRVQWPEGEGPIGIGITDHPGKIEPVDYPIGSAIVNGFRELARTVVLTLSIPILAIRGLVPIEFLRPVGPVGLFQATSQAAAETVRSGWWFPLLYMAATLGAGLGVANLLPIPGLDGGRLMFIALELVRGRRVSPEREGLIHLMGMALLVSLVLVITYFDIMSPVNVDFSLR